MHWTDQTDRFYQMIWPHAATVLRMAQALCHNYAEAEDLAQDTMLKAFKSLGSFREGSDAKAWLLQILRNARIDRLRTAKAKAGTVSLDENVNPPAAPEAQETMDESAWADPTAMMQAFSDAQIIAAMKELPEELRWTLLLVDVEGMDHADAAAVLAIPVGTVKSRAHRGRAMLRTTLASLAKELRLVR